MSLNPVCEEVLNYTLACEHLLRTAPHKIFTDEELNVVHFYVSEISKAVSEQIVMMRGSAHV